jgi:hypothetical protein
MADPAHADAATVEPSQPNVIDGHFEYTEQCGAGSAGSGGSGRGGRSDTPTPEDEIKTARAKLYETIKNALAQPKLYDDQVQYELGCWLRLIDTDLAPDKVMRLLRQAEVTIEALVSANPELILARTVRYRAEMELRRYGGLASRSIARLSDDDPMVLVGVGVFLIMVIGMAGYLIVNGLVYGTLSLGWPVADNPSILPALQAALLGGGVSVLFRLRQFSCTNIRDFDPFLLLWNGLFNPIVGMIFATFVYAMLVSQVISFGTTTVTSPCLWMVGFLAGFSERFTNDMITRAEDMLGAKKKA